MSPTESRHPLPGWSIKVSMNVEVTPIPAKEMQEPVSLVLLKSKDEAGAPTRLTNTENIARPRVRFGSPSVFLNSLWARFASIWTKRFILSLLAGQLVSLCITCTDVTTTELVSRGWALPTTQTLFL